MVFFNYDSTSSSNYDSIPSFKYKFNKVPLYLKINNNKDIKFFIINRIIKDMNLNIYDNKISIDLINSDYKNILEKNTDKLFLVVDENNNYKKYGIKTLTAELDILELNCGDVLYYLLYANHYNCNSANNALLSSVSYYIDKYVDGNGIFYSINDGFLYSINYNCNSANNALLSSVSYYIDKYVDGNGIFYSINDALLYSINYNCNSVNDITI